MKGSTRTHRKKLGRWVARLKSAAETGMLLDLAPGEVVEPERAANWPPERTIPGEALRLVLTDPNLDADPRGLRIRAARFADLLDIQYVTFPHPLSLFYCALEAGLDADGARFRELNLKQVHGRGEVRAVGAIIGGQLSFRGAVLSNPGGNALTLDRAEVNGSVFADKPFCATGEVRALGSTIAGQLILSGAKLFNPTGHALSFDRARIGGDVCADDGFCATGEIRAIGATIAGQLVISEAELFNPDGDALKLKEATIGTLFFTPNRFTGQLNLEGAQVTNLVTDNKADPPGPVIATGWTVSHVRGKLRDDWKVGHRWLSAPGRPDRPDQLGQISVQPWHILADIYERDGDPRGARKGLLHDQVTVSVTRPDWPVWS